MHYSVRITYSVLEKKLVDTTPYTNALTQKPVISWSNNSQGAGTVWRCTALPNWPSRPRSDQIKHGERVSGH